MRYAAMRAKLRMIQMMPWITPMKFSGRLPVWCLPQRLQG